MIARGLSPDRREEMGRGKTKPAEGPQLPGDDGETNGSDLAQPVLLPQPMSRKQRRLARRRRRQLKKLERQLLGRRSRLRPSPQGGALLERAARGGGRRGRGPGARAGAGGLVEQAEETIDERLKEMSESLERQQRGREANHRPHRALTRADGRERQQAAQPRGGSTSVRAAKRNALKVSPGGSNRLS